MEHVFNGVSGRELISFEVAGQEFCLDITDVREIRGWTPATPMPHAPSYMCGMINLRGTVMPVVDVAARLGLGTTAPTSRHVTIVARSGTCNAGLLVDAVNETFIVKAEQIQRPSHLAEMTGLSVEGLIALEGRMVSLISLEHLIPAELSTMPELAASA